MLHLHIIPESPSGGPNWACAEIRLLRPYRHASLRSLVKTSVGRVVPSGRVDAVVIQRGGPGGAGLDYAVELVRECRRRGVPLIYDIDDDLLAEHPSPWIEAIIAAHRQRVRFLLGEADLVTTSTAALAHRCARFNPNVQVWRNALDEGLLAPRDGDEDGADLGYFGTASHLEDLLGVIGSLQEGLSALPDPTAEICGVDEKARSARLFAGLAAVAAIPPNGSYPQFMRGFQARRPWKAGIAPLADNEFNGGKSDIKFLDYAMFGIAAVYPRGAVYAEVQHEETGLLAGPDDWGDMVRRLVEDGPLRRRLRLNSREHLMQTRVLAHRARDLYDILDGHL